MTVEVRNLRKTFGRFTALAGISLAVQPGEFCALLGPSGSGKTTLLRIIAGLDWPDSGSIRFDHQDVGGRNSRDRKVGFVFQHYALFRHMTVFENVAFGLRVRPRDVRPSRVEIRDRVQKLLALVQLEALERRYPTQLSGGQRQRVALARALAIEPQVLLLDEPFGALDAQVRRELRRWLRELHNRLQLTSIFVTHDQEEALELADRVVVMNQGRIEQAGSSRDVYEKPGTPFVYQFIGSAVQLPGEVRGGFVHIDGLRLPVAPGQAPDGEAIVYVRPHDFALHAPAAGSGLSARLRAVAHSGAIVRLDLITEGSERAIEVELPRRLAADLDLQPGACVSVLPERFGLFPVGQPELDYQI